MDETGKRVRFILGLAIPALALLVLLSVAVIQAFRHDDWGFIGSAVFMLVLLVGPFFIYYFALRTPGFSIAIGVLLVAAAAYAVLDFVTAMNRGSSTAGAALLWLPLIGYPVVVWGPLATEVREEETGIEDSQALTKGVAMSAMITLTVQVDPAKWEQVAQANADQLKRISEQAQGMGCVHHRFVGGDGVVMVIDEWDSPDSFQKFFENNTDIPVLMHEAGVTSPPDIKVWNKLDTPDEF